LSSLSQKRLKQFLEYLNSQSIELAIVTQPKNIFYYTGFNSEPYERFMALVVDLKKQVEYLFVPALDEEAANESTHVRNIIPISDEENPYEKLKSTIGGGSKVIGLETKEISLYQQEQLSHFLPNFEYKNIGDFISRQRMIKTPEESAKVLHAVQLIEKVLAEGIKKVEKGMSELDLTAEFDYLMRKFGADGPSFSTTVLSGAKSSLPHGHPDHKKLEEGDFLLIDMGVIADGYCSDITRTFVLGEATKKQKEIYNIVRRATQAGVETAKEGTPIGAIDRVARNVIKEAGYGQYFNNRVGHGLGIDVHEEPSIHEKNDMLVGKGLLFTIEPGIYIPGFGGVRIEEDVYIKEDGTVEVLTSFPTEMQIIDVF
jgi:Xaa-Pro dipeptidase